MTFRIGLVTAFSIAGIFLGAPKTGRTQQPLRYNFQYACGGETVEVGHCSADSDQPGLPRTRPEDNYCLLYYPDRPKRGGFTVQVVELRSEVEKKLRACGALDTKSANAPDNGGDNGNTPSAEDVQRAAAEAHTGEQYLEAKDYLRAIEYFKRSIATAPSRNAYLDLGVAYSRLKKNSDAIRAYKDAVRIGPDNPEVHVLLAKAYHGLALEQVSANSSTDPAMKAAESEAREAIRLKPDYQVAYY